MWSFFINFISKSNNDELNKVEKEKVNIENIIELHGIPFRRIDGENSAYLFYISPKRICKIFVFKKKKNNYFLEKEHSFTLKEIHGKAKENVRKIIENHEK